MARAPVNAPFDDWAITYTFCECGENHAGMERLGDMAPVGGGLSIEDLQRAAAQLRADGVECTVVDLAAAVPPAGAAAPPAAVLVMRAPLPAMLRRGGAAGAAGAAAAGAAAADGGAAGDAAADCQRQIFEEQRVLAPLVDKRALMRGRVVNKHARWNLIVADAAQEPDYERGRGRIVTFEQLPLLRAARAGIAHYFGARGAGLLAEANYYYDPAQTGIGFHGDAERRIVIALRLGAPIPLHFQWFHRGAPVGARVEIALQPGDMYAMSEKAVGTDWRRSSILTLRHAAGAPAFLRTK